MLPSLVAAIVLLALSGCSPREARPTADTAPRRAESPEATEPAPAAPAPVSDDTRGEDDELAIADDEDEGIREVPGCIELEGPDACTGVGKVMLGCTALGNVLEREPTSRLVECLQERNGTPQICDASVLETCGLRAIDGTPASAESERACGRIFDACAIADAYVDIFTRERCARGVSSARPDRSAEFVDCMVQKCDIPLCISGLL